MASAWSYVGSMAAAWYEGGKVATATGAAAWWSTGPPNEARDSSWTEPDSGARVSTCKNQEHVIC